MSRLRSWMFVPGNQPRRLEKVKHLPADAVIYDLEDAVPLAEKGRARQLVKQALRENNGRMQYVRVNDPSTPYYAEDLAEMADRGLSGIMLPKAATGEQILAVDRELTALEQRRGLLAGSIEIVPLIESAQGLFHAYEIASAGARIRRLAFGSVDFALDIGATLTKEGTEILFARSQLVVVSRAAGIEPPIDAVFADVLDREGLRRDAQLARQLGFQGKLVIHPEQLAIVHACFSPTAEELEEARIIAAAFEEALAAGSASIQVDGKLVDYPVAERARRLLQSVQPFAEQERE
ncbi:CoA ester lyase [Brevibacillus composti]|uniref:CoA ester lyase n=1 Tax=Brevibacillus composti TaxID=2796470 RepID=A0A7T5JN32_9BACL|nr:CoA ester lyase [Brevibacillus composti]QQE73605.1 CoA ester lyase [Brevibacillus composti]QUO40687.1 CoA ester lyase [Brevibacillus composti]